VLEEVCCGIDGEGVLSTKDGVNLVKKDVIFVCLVVRGVLCLTCDVDLLRPVSGIGLIVFVMLFVIEGRVLLSDIRKGNKVICLY
jgi:hypothetical protein